ncbi:alpha/beta fold hydrolase [Streptomyces sp. TBY4]|uniref:thioesterase II family protein n=1 Tax=Streptomyces sp. TBY4 TaxID=2962030 RepID=UPI0020B77B54|nr:alpha/beta fold hydrolase [Streptomyces sp. TBY4]MCP3760511.1 thioesterase domain-containing protein [Streptomyces sp. TBY4]
MTTVADASLVSRWLPFTVPDGPLRLFCLPHAGGSASAYRAWHGRLGRVAICPLQPPGRETRLRETPFDRMEPLVAELADVVLATAGQDPYAVYGHSLGGLVGFELLREIRRRGGPMPERFFVSGCPAPQLPDEHGDPPVAGMTDDEVVGLLRRLGGTPEWLLADPAVLQMILPPFRADFSVKETYRHREEPPLDLPITALAGTHDPRADPAAMRGWRDQTVGGFTSHVLTGGHFVMLERPELTHRHLADALRPWM